VGCLALAGGALLYVLRVATELILAVAGG